MSSFQVKGKRLDKKVKMYTDVVIFPLFSILISLGRLERRKKHYNTKVLLFIL